MLMKKSTTIGSYFTLIVQSDAKISSHNKFSVWFIFKTERFLLKFMF